MSRALALRLASLLVLSPVFAACVPDTSVSDGEVAEDDADALSLAFSTLPVTKSNAPQGITVITKKSAYVAFFGLQPPAGLDFNKSWVVHYSMGVMNTGGYGIAISDVERKGSGSSAKLVVHLAETVPGPNCPVTQSLTNPQVTVKIPKQKAGIVVEPLFASTVTDCGTVQNWCATALCGPDTRCDEFTDACATDLFCPRAKCANGYVCDEALDACVGRPCDQADSNSCPSGFVCDNQIACITQPCPVDYRCEPAPTVTCADIGWVGVCQGPDLKYCDGDVMHSESCAPGQCGWDDANAYYDCL
ncbi:MAG: protease complex subunit PrcB family protein [Polyangiaceae bacterium]